MVAICSHAKIEIVKGIDFYFSVSWKGTRRDISFPSCSYNRKPKSLSNKQVSNHQEGISRNYVAIIIRKEHSPSYCYYVASTSAYTSISSK